MNSSRQYSIKVNGNDYSVEIVTINEGHAVVEVNGATYEVAFESLKKPSKTPVLTREKVFPTSAERLKGTAKPQESKIRGVKSPLPGVILDTHVKEGEKINAGDLLLIMEAMKMENNIVAPIDGIIKSVNVSKGDNVMEGDLLVEIGE